MSERERVERAFEAIRRELEIPTDFPPEVLRAAEEAVERAGWRGEAGRADREDLPMVTIDPAGSRDLDQAVHIERLGEGHRVRYAIADVACFVERGGVVEAEAWKRGLTHYSPDRRDPLYPPSISQGAGSLLPGETRPAILFTLDLDGTGALASAAVERARVRSRAQLTYRQALEHIEGGGTLFGAEPFAESLLLLREVGERRLAVERARGGVSLPIIDQRVTQGTALRLGYVLEYEEPNAAEEWNAQISLLTGHAAAVRMLAAGVGLLRTAPAPSPDDVDRFRTAARALGFEWPDRLSYPDFLHSLDPAHPRLPILVWQARGLMRGADYVAFDGAPPEHREHAALAMAYAHCTAPLRRLADRYVLDLLVALEEGREPPAEERATLARLPATMDAAERRASRLERRAVDAAEAHELAPLVGTFLPAVVLDVRREWVEVQIADPPVRTRVPLREGDPAVALGGGVAVRVVAAAEGEVELRIAESE